MSFYCRFGAVFLLAMVVAITLGPAEHGVLAIDCRACSIALCDHPCKNGVNTACQACHSKDVPQECPTCNGRKRREAFVAAAEHMALFK